MCRSRGVLDIGPQLLSCMRQGSFVGGHCSVYARVVGSGASRILLCLSPILPFRSTEIIGVYYCAWTLHKELNMNCHVCGKHFNH